MIKGYIFDYGGTLDTRGNHWGKVLWHSYERNKVPVNEADFREAYIYAERYLATNRVIMPHFTFHDTLNAKLRLQMQYLKENGKLGDHIQYHSRVLEDVYRQAMETTRDSVRVLKKIKEEYPIVLVSNFYGNVNTVLREFGFDGVFNDVVESAIVGIRKPDPRIYKIGVEKLGTLPQEIMVVGDSYDKDILPAASIGCKTTWIKGEGWTDEKIEAPIADNIIHDLSELV